MLLIKTREKQENVVEYGKSRLLAVYCSTESDTPAIK